MSTLYFYRNSLFKHIRSEPFLFLWFIHSHLHQGMAHICVIFLWPHTCDLRNPFQWTLKISAWQLLFLLLQLCSNRYKYMDIRCFIDDLQNRLHLRSIFPTKWAKPRLEPTNILHLKHNYVNRNKTVNCHYCIIFDTQIPLNYQHDLNMKNLLYTIMPSVSDWYLIRF